MNKRAHELTELDPPPGAPLPAHSMIQNSCHQPRAIDSEALRRDPEIQGDRRTLSAWTRSQRKRLFDVAMVLAFSPILLLLLFVIAAAVLVSSGMPVVFRQTRIGRGGREFTIYKFRTMRPSQGEKEIESALKSGERITLLGRVLRRLKLDELPQTFNVLLGDMSLVGPRPRIPEQQFIPIACRPGLTGPATLVFAREETLFAQIPEEALPSYYRNAILPAKHRIDSEYLQRATINSDLRILFNTIIGRWGTCSAPIPSHSSEPAISQLQLDSYGTQQLE
jgi:lipopolysaccharide/colanic/teichoic acid biosynthesis glycosyltransferase